MSDGVEPQPAEYTCTFYTVVMTNERQGTATTQDAKAGIMVCHRTPHPQPTGLRPNGMV